MLTAIVGPTASGKSAVAMELARRTGAEIISVDSMQVYRGMDVGTAKPTVLERREIRHHMIDIVDPAVDYSVSEFSEAGRRILDGAGIPLVIVGGSGLHFRSLVDPMSFAPTEPDVRRLLEENSLDTLRSELESVDAGAAQHVDIHNKRRVVRALEVFHLGGGTPSERAQTSEAERLRRYDADYEFRAFGLDPGDLSSELIARRLERMRDGGLVDEVKGLAQRLGRTARAAVGYREILDALDGKWTLDRAFEEIARNTRKLARRQRTWFQRDPRVQWIPWSEDPVQMCERIQEELL
ncbi:MAG: tRNA (adenosine(37)-N6)-dimethylallyltransferase MiaA [Acidimicrobiia bacterium]